MMEKDYETILLINYRIIRDKTIYSEKSDETISEFVSSPTSRDKK